MRVYTRMPEIEGWFWFRPHGASRWQMVRVFDNDGHGWRQDELDGESSGADDQWVQAATWYGPIPPPEELFALCGFTSS